MNTFFSIIAQNIQKEILNEISEIIYSEQFIKDWIVTIIQERIYESGRDSKGQKLITDRSKEQNGTFDYSNYTVKQKKKFGKRFANVTLKDKNAFYDSFEIETNNIYAEIKANFEKENSNIYENFKTSYSSFDTFENAILIMNEKEKELFITELFLPRLVSQMKFRLLENV